ncbi:MAG: hypothetical protein H7175_16125 [Burkholderiales bacterium]|nr:hypothetical protein [Anaerolineae bacterium]
MAIDIAWDNEAQTVIRVDFVSKWDWNDYHEMVKFAAQMMNEVGHTVDLIYNLQQSAPISAGAITHAATTMRLLDGRMGLMMVVSNAGYIKALLSTFQLVYKNWSDRVIGAASVEDARTYITRNAGKGG